MSDISENEEPLTPVAINFASEQELITIPGVKGRLARTIVAVRENSGNLTKEILEVLMRKKMSAKTLAMIDFTKSKTLTANCPVSSSESEGEEDVPSKVGGEGDAPWVAGFAKVVEAASRVLSVKQESQDAKLTTPVGVKPPGAKTQAFKYDQKLMSPADFMTTKSPAVSRLATSTPSRKLQFADPLNLDNNQLDSSGLHSSSWREQNNLIKSLPKTLTYDGTSKWEAFRLKFTHFVTAANLSEEDSLFCLCWCLTGKAAEYHALLSEREERLSYSSLFSKLEARFGEQELAEAAQVRFQQAVQSSGETLEEWADRVLTLGTRAFKKLPETFVSAQVVNRFCQGLFDKEAGHHVCMLEPKTIQQAIQNVRKYQQVHSAMYGKKRRKQEDEERVYAVHPSPSEAQASAGVDFTKALKELQETLTRTILSQSKRPFRRSGTLTCYACKEPGHFKRDCPKLKSLNDKGAGKQVVRRPNQK